VGLAEISPKLSKFWTNFHHFLRKLVCFSPQNFIRDQENQTRKFIFQQYFHQTHSRFKKKKFFSANPAEWHNAFSKIHLSFQIFGKLRRNISEAFQKCRMPSY
jgi:hypothetical protein